MPLIIKADAKGSNDFAEDLITAKLGEEKVSAWLRSLASVERVINVTENKVAQTMDIDFEVILKKSNPEHHSHYVTWEVKTDNYISKNSTISYEIVSSIAHGTPGCMMKTKADFIAFYNPEFDTFYYWKTKDLRDYVAKNSDKFEVIRVYNYHKGDSNPQVGLCIKVPHHDALTNGKGKAVSGFITNQPEENFTSDNFVQSPDFDY